MTLDFKSLWFDGPENVKIKRETLLINDRNKLLIKSIYSGISLGSESLVLKGLVPEEMAPQMKLKYQQGDFQFPIKYGYSLVGKVISEGDFYGKNVHILHPHQTYALVDKKDVFVIDESLPLERACLLSNMETAINAIWDAKPLLGDKIAIVGFGLVGSLIARILKDIQGYQIWVNDISSSKRELAKNLGFEIFKTGKKREFDIVFHCSGDYAGLQKAIEFGGYEAKIIELSWYGTKTGKMKLGGRFHYLRQKLISSQVSHIAKPNSTFADRKNLCISLLKRPFFDDHITYSVSFSKASQIYKDIDQIRKKHLGVVITY